MNNEKAIKKDSRKCLQDLIYLLACGIHLRIPEKVKVEQMDLEAVYKLSQVHSISALAYMALEQLPQFDWKNEEIHLKWKEEKNKAVRKNALLDIARADLCSFLENEGIWYLPLKGCVLKEMYPKAGMRQMSDNDILFDPDYRQKVKDYFVANGYKVESIGGNHDVYQKNPVLNFEMHISLFGKTQNPKWVDYYADVKKKLKQEDLTRCAMRFTDEDFYIYMIVHAKKHFSSAGTGLRLLLDCFIYLENKKDSLNWNYIERELEKLEAAEFEQLIHSLSEQVFGTLSLELDGLDDRQEKMLRQLALSGTYGTLKNTVNNEMRCIQKENGKIQKRTKFRYVFKRLIPEKEYYQNSPRGMYVYQHKVLLLGFLFFRLAKAVIKNNKRVVQEIKCVFKVN